MSLDEVVDVNISIQDSSVTRDGFGVPLLLGSHSVFTTTERRRVYTSAAAMLEDGFLSTDALYKQAVKVFSQTPRPTRIMVGVRDTPVAQVTNISVDGSDDGNYTIAIDATTLDGSVEYTHAASSETATQIRDALIVLINAGSQPVTAAPGAGDTIDLTSDNAGQPHFVVLTNDNGNLSQTTTTPNTGLTEDIAAVTQVDSDWYCLLIPERTDALIIEGAKYIETVRKIFSAQSSDTNIKDAAFDSGAPEADIGSYLFANNYSRTFLSYYSDDAEYLDAAIVGKQLPQQPGSTTWKFKNLSGIAADTFTSTELINLRGDPQSSGQGKAVNLYRDFGGSGSYEEGTMSSGEFIDIIRGIDKLHSDIQVGIAGLFKSVGKVPFTDKGIGLIENQVRGALLENTSTGLIAEDPSFTITVPLAADVPAAEKAKRFLNGDNCIAFAATLAGAIHAVEVCGTVSA